MRYVALLVLVACGAPDPLPDPAPDAGPVEDAGVDAGEPVVTLDTRACAIPVGSVTLTGAALDVGTTLDGEPAQIGQGQCPDGFGYALTRGTTTVLVRLVGGDRWTAGATLDGVELHGSMTYQGLSDPFDPAPRAGQHRASFALSTGAALADGTISTRW